jgi:thiamine pyrophosphokinase
LTVRAIVVAGSNLAAELDSSLLAADLLVAVDGGAEALARAGLMPATLIGDMASITLRTREALEAQGVEVVLLATAKDETDTEAALRLVIDRGADAISIYGALGGPRLDHLVGNLLLLSSPWLANARVRLVDDRHEAFLAKGDVTVIGERGDIVSLLPLTPRVEDVWTEGLLYPLAGEPLFQSATRGVSNVMTGAGAQVTHGAGTLLLIHCKGR